MPDDQRCSRSLLITGASSGLGRAFVRRLALAGFNVIATVRSPADLESLRREHPPSRGVLLDLTDETSIQHARHTIESIVGPLGLYGLINNAGIAVPGPIELLTSDDFREQFEVNVIGQMAVTRAMLPMLRSSVERCGTARIVNIGSIAGRIGQPMLGAYAASKAALASLSESLRHEVEPMHIQVCLVEPGAARSDIWHKARTRINTILTDPSARSLYGNLIDRVSDLASRAEAHAIDADLVARVVERCLTDRHARLRTLVGRDAKSAALIKRWLPDRWFHSAVRRMIARGGR
jgi:NAD(P)-dependent dehydrogenase (short-subunit alcohol dehydrogenase family)